MDDKDCASYLTHDIITEAFRNKQAVLTGNESNRQVALYDAIAGCLYTSYHDIFIIRSVARYQIYFRENRLEETGEEAFLKAMEAFETFVAVAGLHNKKPVKTIFYEFYRRIFLNSLRRVEKTDEYVSGISNDADNDTDRWEERNMQDKRNGEIFNDVSYDWNREINLDCLEQFLTEDSRDVKVIKWRHFERLTSWQLAEKLGIGRHAATVLVERCMKRLRAFMNTCNEEQHENQH